MQNAVNMIPILISLKPLTLRVIEETILNLKSTPKRLLKNEKYLNDPTVHRIIQTGVDQKKSEELNLLKGAVRVLRVVIVVIVPLIE